MSKKHYQRGNPGLNPVRKELETIIGMGYRSHRAWAVAGTWRFRPDEQPRDSAMPEVAPKLPQTVRNGIVYVGEGVTFERVRRITGYLVGTVDRFNNAKKAELRDRLKHDQE